MTAVRLPRTLFVANRGEIARRIARTAGRLGVAVVVPPLDGPDAVDLLDVHAVVAASTTAGADAVHPGYGFLAESPDLAHAVAAAGLTWVGPSSAAIRALGDKAVARGVARRLGIPVAEGEEPEDQSDASLAAAARRIGYPVLVKPAAGGGGKGIRAVTDEAELPSALAAARREAGRAFGDERLLLERFVRQARHVEVQVLADMHGNVVHLGDRDCSLQRRHQKLLEEAPAPGLDPAVRRALWDAATRLAAEVGYVNAGTCEFLIGADGGYVFLEMNARLQVEHPVTELVVDRDLVADQLGIAAGASLDDLGLDQQAVERQLESGGHAVEVRLNAEDPAAGFLPAAGPVVALRWPDGAATFGPVGGSGIRVDAGVDAGDTIRGRFDPLLAKVIAHGRDRAEALDRLAGALDGTEVLGVATNLSFLRRLVGLEVVRTPGAATTRTVEEDPAVRDAAAHRPRIPPQAWQVAALLVVGSTAGGAWDGGWRLNAPARVRLVVESADDGPAAVVEVPSPGVASAAEAVGAAPFARLDGEAAHVAVDGQSVAFRLEPPPDLDEAAGRSAPDGPGVAGPTDLHAPMTGVVIAVHAAHGTAVASGEAVVTLEAMKMEHVVVAPRAGRIDALLVRPGDQVERGRVVARLAGEP